MGLLVLLHAGVEELLEDVVAEGVVEAEEELDQKLL